MKRLDELNSLIQTGKYREITFKRMPAEEELKDRLLRLMAHDERGREWGASERTNAAPLRKRASGRLATTPPATPRAAATTSAQLPIHATLKFAANNNGQ